MPQSIFSLIHQLKQQGIQSPHILQAIAQVPREKFISDSLQDQAYENYPLSIGYQQTISQPYIVARMTELLFIEGMQKVLEIGTGSGYQAAVLAQLVAEVYTVERVFPLLKQAEKCFKQLHLKHIHSHYGDGALGWIQHAPYNGIIVTAAAPQVPTALLQQLAPEGRLIMPLGENGQHQQLIRITRKPEGFQQETFDAVIFVPLLAGTRSK